jgi:Homeodomain-like domain
VCVHLADVPLETRVEAALAVIVGEPMSVWGRAQILMTALWPRPAPIPEPPPIYIEWKRRGKCSTPAERAELVRLREAGWSVGAIATASGWSLGQVKRWTRGAAPATPSGTL